MAEQKKRNRPSGSVKHSSGLTIRKPDLKRVQPIEWLWNKRLVLGAINLLVHQGSSG